MYWGEQYIPSGLAAVLFGVLPLYVAPLGAGFLPDQPLRGRVLAGVLVALGGLALAFGESLDARRRGPRARGAAVAARSPRSARAIGNVSIKRRGGALDPVVLNGWAMLGAGALLLAVSAPGRGLGRRRLDRQGGRLDRLPGRDRLRGRRS